MPVPPAAAIAARAPQRPARGSVRWPPALLRPHRREQQHKVSSHPPTGRQRHSQFLVGLRFQRQPHDKDGAFTDLAFDFDFPPMPGHNPVHHRQPQTDAFPFPLGGKKRIEYPGEVFVRNAVAVVCNLQDHFLNRTIHPGAHPDLAVALALCRFGAVHDQVDQHLL